MGLALCRPFFLEKMMANVSQVVAPGSAALSEEINIESGEVATFGLFLASGSISSSAVGTIFAMTPGQNEAVGQFGRNTTQVRGPLKLRVQVPASGAGAYMVR